MVKVKVKIVSMQDADKFNKICSKYDCDMDLQSDKYYVNAKSIMGIFSLDLSKALVLLSLIHIYKLPSAGINVADAGFCTCRKRACAGGL